MNSGCFLLPGTLEPHLSGLLWTAMLISLAIVIALPKPHGIRALIASTILRLIFSVGLQPTLFLLGAFNVSVKYIFPGFVEKLSTYQSRNFVIKKLRLCPRILAVLDLRGNISKEVL